MNIIQRQQQCFDADISVTLTLKLDHRVITIEKTISPRRLLRGYQCHFDICGPRVGMEQEMENMCTREKYILTAERVSLFFQPS